MNQFNSLCVDEQTEPPREWNIQYPPVLIKYWNSPPKTIPVVSSIIGRLNYRAVDNGDVKFYSS